MVKNGCRYHSLCVWYEMCIGFDKCILFLIQNGILNRYKNDIWKGDLEAFEVGTGTLMGSGELKLGQNGPKMGQSGPKWCRIGCVVRVVWLVDIYCMYRIVCLSVINAPRLGTSVIYKRPRLKADTTRYKNIKNYVLSSVWRFNKIFIYFYIWLGGD